MGTDKCQAGRDQRQHHPKVVPEVKETVATRGEKGGCQGDIRSGSGWPGGLRVS